MSSWGGFSRVDSSAGWRCGFFRGGFFRVGFSPRWRCVVFSGWIFLLDGVVFSRWAFYWMRFIFLVGCK